MSYVQQFLWIIFPYISLTIFIAGHIFRYNTDQFGWSARSSEFLEKDRLKWGSLLLHYGILFVFSGHVMGVLIPKWLIQSMGINDEMYHLMALSGGIPAGLATAAGLILLLWRRGSVREVSANTSIADWVSLLLLSFVVVVGLFSTLGYSALGSGFDYRATIGPWFRGLLLFRPDAALMAHVPWVFQLHVIAAFLLFAVWPFTRLVHIWSIPLEYIGRGYILYRTYDCPKESPAGENDNNRASTKIR
jgi:nitrate reductase gamma subunit